MFTTPPFYLETQPSNLHVQPAPRSLLPLAVVSGHFKATPSRTPHSQVSGRSTHGSLDFSASPHLQIGFTNVRLLTDFFVSLGRVFFHPVYVSPTLCQTIQSIRTRGETGFWSLISIDILFATIDYPSQALYFAPSGM